MRGLSPPSLCFCAGEKAQVDLPDQHLLGLLHFVGDDDAHLVDDLQHAVLVHHHIMRERHSLRIVEEFFQTVDQLQYIHSLLRTIRGDYVLL